MGGKKPLHSLRFKCLREFHDIRKTSRPANRLVRHFPDKLELGDQALTALSIAHENFPGYMDAIGLQTQ